MGWEEDYEEFENDWDDEELGKLDELEDIIEDMERAILHVDIKLVEEQVCLILDSFFEKFGYSLKPEVENKTFMISYDRGYVAAYFTPVEFNKKSKYYTFVFNPDYKHFPEAYQYSLEFTDAFFDDDGEEEDDANTITIAAANNVQTISDLILRHWITQETSAK